MSQAIMKRGRGRPTVRTPETDAEILRRLAGGESLSQVCRDEHLPSARAVHYWMRDDPELEEEYHRATQCRAELIADFNEELAASAAVPTLTNRAGDPVVDGARVQAIRLALENNRWRLERMHPRRFGDQKIFNVEARAEVVQLVAFADLGTARLAASEAGTPPPPPHALAPDGVKDDAAP